MIKEAVLHVPMSQYAHGVTEDRLVIRIRTAKNDIESCTLYYGDTACRKTPIDFFPVSMKKVASDLMFDYYEANFTSMYRRVYYYFEIHADKQVYYYFADFFRTSLPADRSEYYKLPFNRREDIAYTPDWVKDAVIYNIFPDSFASGHRSISDTKEKKKYKSELMEEALLVASLHGGTINGISENVDYLEDLGINCIYINPLFAAQEYHKYDTLDYFTVDPCFGTNEDFKAMVRKMHEHGIRVLIDGVFNHCGWFFYAFDDVVRNQEKSKYVDWFYDLKFPVERPESGDDYPTYECFAYERLMPKLNTSNPEVERLLIEAGRFWIEEMDIDGWRLDVASELNDDFWRHFRAAVKSIKPDCFLIGEVWESAGHWMSGDMFDSVMNYDCRKFAKNYFAEEEIDSETFNAGVTSMNLRYRSDLQFGQLNLLDSHDVSRFFTVCGENKEKFSQAVIFQMLSLGVPSIFYGDEQGITGELESEYRHPMIFDGDRQIYDLYKSLISLRHERKEIRRGEFRALIMEKGKRVYAFERSLDGQRTIVILNSGSEGFEYKLSCESFKIALKSGVSVLDKTIKIDGYGYCILTTNEEN